MGACAKEDIFFYLQLEYAQKKVLKIYLNKVKKISQVQEKVKTNVWNLDLGKKIINETLACIDVYRIHTMMGLLFGTHSPNDHSQITFTEWTSVIASSQLPTDWESFNFFMIFYSSRCKDLKIAVIFVILNLSHFFGKIKFLIFFKNLFFDKKI